MIFYFLYNNLMTVIKGIYNGKKLYLGVDIGTYETKGVLVDHEGNIYNQASIKHEMIVPKPGWAEHSPKDVW